MSSDAERAGLGERRVGAQPGEHDVLLGLGAVPGAGDDALHALAAQAAAGGHAHRALVAGLDARLHAAQSQAALAGVGQRPVGERPDGPGGVPAAAVPGVQGPGQLAGVLVEATHVDAADQVAGVLEREADQRAVVAPAAPALDGGGVGLAARDLLEPEPVVDQLVVARDREVDVLVAPGPQQQLPSVRVGWSHPPP